MNFLQETYKSLILKRPVITIALLFILISCLVIHIPQFRLDASSESLSLENDQAIEYYRSIKKKYGSDDYLIITYSPHDNSVFDKYHLNKLASLKDKLLSLENVESVISILDVPLIKSPPLTLQELRTKNLTLLSPEADITLARQELISSPFYENLLISSDGEVTALLVQYKSDQKLQDLIDKKNHFKEKLSIAPLSKKEKKELSDNEREYKIKNAQSQIDQRKDIKSVRKALRQYKKDARIYIGGVPMIVSDSIDFIERDLKTFGSIIFCFLLILLGLIFRKIRWILLPMLVCTCVGVSIIGFLGLVDWPVTIVSANFISLILIFTLSFCVHQIVHYREISADNPQAGQHELVDKTVSGIVVPCFYMACTTVIGFCSLIVSDIRPVIDFGWMMAVGIMFSFCISFTLMPAAMTIFPPERQKNSFDFTRKITSFFSYNIKKYSKAALSIFGLMIILSVWGINFLYVQNRFIDYYKKDTEIYQGMKLIDERLGGTTPLDIIIDAPQDFIAFQKEEKEMLEAEGMMADDNVPDILGGYWFSEILTKDVSRIHQYLDDLPETGKILSIYTITNILQSIDKDQLIDRFYLGVLYKNLPETMKEILFYPYISEDGNQLRFSIRVFESKEGLNREELLKEIKSHLVNEFGLEKEQIHTTGMLVLYNNILKTLFSSQILTIGVVFITMFLIFTVLFRSIKIAAVAIIPNITIVAFVLGIMGWFNIPLDIMTITIAAICFGMADDNTIHYIHRFREEFKKTPNYWNAVRKSHDTIGRAMYYTTVTIMLGFSILAFSNFVPTIYFGLLTAFAMLIALIADLILLPLLLVFFKPLGKEKPIA